MTLGQKPPGDKTSKQLSTEIIALVGLGRRVYNTLGTVSFCFTAGIGVWLIQGRELKDVTQSTVIISWLVLCFANAFVLRSGTWSCILQGTGYVGWDSFLTTVIQLLSIVAQIVIVLCSGGIIGLAIAAACFSLLQRGLFGYIVSRKRPDFNNIRSSWSLPLFKSIFAPATRAWLTGLGGALIFNSDQFFISSNFGVADVSAYRAANVVVHNFSIIAVTFALAGNVFISRLWAEGEIQQLHSIVKFSARLTIAIMVSAAWPLMFVGDSLFTVWLGKGNFVGYLILGIFLATEILEAHSYVLSTASRATEDEAFVISTLAAGFIKITGAFLLTNHFGLVGLAIATPLGLITTNSWYMVYRALHRLKICGRVYITDVIMPSVGFAAFLGAAVLTTGALAKGADAEKYTLGVLCTSALASFAGAWIFVLTPSQRLSLYGSLKGKLC